MFSPKLGNGCPKTSTAPPAASTTPAPGKKDAPVTAPPYATLPAVSGSIKKPPCISNGATLSGDGISIGSK